jgi:hypothetical protein
MKKATGRLLADRRLLISRSRGRGKISAADGKVYADYSSRSPVKFSSNWKILTKFR